MSQFLDQAFALFKTDSCADEYHRTRAFQERTMARRAHTLAARDSHAAMAEYHEALITARHPAFAAIEERPELAILLAVSAKSPEPGYGWIEPGPATAAADSVFFRIQRFWEKPEPALAKKLWSGGCLCNSLVLVGRLATLLRLTMRAMPALRSEFSRVRCVLGTPHEEAAIARLYASLPPSNFSEEVLARHPDKWTLLPVRGVEWSDLGEADRVHQALAQSRIVPRWKQASTARRNQPALGLPAPLGGQSPIRIR